MEPDKTNGFVVKALRLVAHEEAKALLNPDQLRQIIREELSAMKNNRDQVRARVPEELSTKRRNNVKKRRKSSSSESDVSDSLSEKFRIRSSESDSSDSLKLSPSRSRDQSPNRSFEISKALATYLVCLWDWGKGPHNQNTVRLLNTGESALLIMHEPTLAFPCHVYPILSNYKLTLAQISDFIRSNPSLAATELDSETMDNLYSGVHISSRKFNRPTTYFAIDSLQFVSLCNRIRERWPKLAKPLEIALPEGNKFLKACSINLPSVKNKPDWFNPHGVLTEFLKSRGD